MSKISKLIPLLGSPVDTEVVATARAIDRILKASGVDWHWLSAKIGADETLYNVQDKPIAPTLAPPPAWQTMTHFELRAWLAAINGAIWLGPYEREIVESVGQSVHAGVEKRITPKQGRTLNVVLARAAVMGVRP